MKPSWPVKKLKVYIVGAFLILFAFLFFSKSQFTESLISLILLVVLLKIDDLRKIIFRDGGLEANFENFKEEKIKEDLRENKEATSQDNIKYYKNLENLIIKKVHEQIGGELKAGVTFVYGVPEKPEFQYVPDGVIRKGDEIIFLEIKHVIDPKLTKSIIEKAVQNLTHVLTRLKPSAGGQLRAKLIIASRIDLDTSGIPLPKDIEIQILKI